MIRKAKQAMRLFAQSTRVIVLLALSLAPALAQRPEADRDLLVGAIRWDNWRLDGDHGELIDDPALADRIPYFAVRLPNGKLGFPGDMPHVLAADVKYAQAAGIDYFIFGYYLDTGAWRRDKKLAQAVNRAYRTYLALHDRSSVRFALSFNWSFPREDVDAVVKVILEVSAHPDYVHTTDGALPVFFFTPNVATWAKGLGGEMGAAEAVREIRARVEKATGRKLYMTAMLFGIAEGGPLAIRLGFDAIATYANGLGGGGRAVPYSACAEGARQFWTRAEKLPVAFLPTVTMGWDYRPILKRPTEQPPRRADASWCEKARDDEWIAQIRAAVARTMAHPRNKRFRSILIYAWNEFSEGGWIAPTTGEGTRRIDAVAKALDRERRGRSFEVRWPAHAPPPGCGQGQPPKDIANYPAHCSLRDPRIASGWPCPQRYISTQQKNVEMTGQHIGFDTQWRTAECLPKAGLN